MGVKKRKVVEKREEPFVPSTMPDAPEEIPAEAGDPEFAKAQAAIDGGETFQEVERRNILDPVQAVLQAAAMLSGNDYETLYDKHQKDIVAVTLKNSPEMMPGSNAFRRFVLTGSIYVVARDFLRAYRQMEANFSEVISEDQTAQADEQKAVETGEGDKATGGSEENPSPESSPRRPARRRGRRKA